jgi:MFS family permease
VSLTVSDLAETFGRTKTDITWGITLVLMFRSVGSIVFGIAADRYGRKWPFVVNNVLFIVLELVSLPFSSVTLGVVVIEDDVVFFVAIRQAFSDRVCQADSRSASWRAAEHSIPFIKGRKGLAAAALHHDPRFDWVADTWGILIL